MDNTQRQLRGSSGEEPIKGLKKQGTKLPARATTQMSSDYRPELDATAELDANYITMFQELIGYLIWEKEIDRVNILHDVLVLSAFQAAPREGHLQQVFHIFDFIK